MTTISVFQSVTIDGVMQGPGRPDEDPRGGFTRGGWAQGFQDEVSMAFVAESMSTQGGLLFGHRTYEDLLRTWTSMPEPNPFTRILIESPKYVVSRSQSTRLTWPNSILVAGDAVERVRQLREESPLPLTILGSGELIRSLHPAGLIDEYVLQIHPIILGSGTRLFGASERADLELVACIPTGTGVIIARYRVSG